ncbi:MAG: hypothetical protein K940chlam3_01153 [Chlamydiae bacterium]|nr:hypothetical protein [Chlamydiota bacterium]
MKKYFFTGLAILLPLVLTILVAIFVINLLTNPFAGIIHGFLSRFEFIHGTVVFKNPQVLATISRILALICFVAVILLIGILGRWYFFHTLIRYAEYVFHKIPFVNKIYKACKDVVQNVFYSEKGSFQTVVLVPYPYEDILAIGLVTQDALVQGKEGEQQFISVFVPATPNPTMGFILLFEKDQLIFTDMSVRHALQLLISCGAKLENFSIVDSK